MTTISSRRVTPTWMISAPAANREEMLLSCQFCPGLIASLGRPWRLDKNLGSEGPADQSASTSPADSRSAALLALLPTRHRATDTRRVGDQAAPNLENMRMDCGNSGVLSLAGAHAQNGLVAATSLAGRRPDRNAAFQLASSRRKVLDRSRSARSRRCRRWVAILRATPPRALARTDGRRSRRDPSGARVTHGSRRSRRSVRISADRRLLWAPLVGVNLRQRPRTPLPFTARPQAMIRVAGARQNLAVPSSLLASPVGTPGRAPGGSP